MCKKKKRERCPSLLLLVDIEVGGAHHARQLFISLLIYICLFFLPWLPAVLFFFIGYLVHTIDRSQGEYEDTFFMSDNFNSRCIRISIFLNLVVLLPCVCRSEDRKKVF